MTAADPRRERLDRIASACPQCAGHKPQRSDAASTNELHTAIAAAEDVVDPRSAGSDFQPDPVPQGVMESIAAMGAEQDRRNVESGSISHCDICGRTGSRYRVPQDGHRRGQYLCDACFTKHAAPCRASVLIDDLPPAYIAISDDGDECIVKRFDSEDAANRYAKETSDSTAGNVGMVVMPSRVAFAAPDLLEACKKAAHWMMGSGEMPDRAFEADLCRSLTQAIAKATNGGAK